MILKEKNRGFAGLVRIRVLSLLFLDDWLLESYVSGRRGTAFCDFEVDSSS